MKKGFLFGFFLLYPLLGVGSAPITLARDYFRFSDHHLERGEWEKALWSLRIALFLDPDFGSAGEKMEKLLEDLKGEAEMERMLGERASLVLRHQEATIHRGLAKRYAPEEENETVAVLKDEVVEKKATLDLKGFLDSGKREEAILSLKELLRREQDNERAKKLLLNLQGSDEKREPHLLGEIQSKFDRAEMLFKEGKKGMNENNSLLAYKQMKEALKLFREEELKPPFYKELLIDLKTNETVLLNDLENQLARMERELNRPLADLKTLVLKLEGFTEEYPANLKVATLIQKVYDRLQALAEPGLMEAKTLLELEGCRGATTKFRETMERALFQEVPAWQEANRQLNVCLVINSTPLLF